MKLLLYTTFILNFCVRVIFAADLIDEMKSIQKHFSSQVFEEIQNLSKQLVKNCDPSNCLLVGIGRSPTPMMKYLEVSGSTNLLNLPLSNFRYLPSADQIDPNFFETPIRALNNFEEKKLFEYFDFIFDGKLNLHHKTIKLVDYTMSGVSLYSVSQYMEKYLLSRNSKIATTSVGIVSHSRISTVERVAEHLSVTNSKYIVLNGDTKINYYFQYRQGFDQFSDYEKFDFIERINTESTTDVRPIRNQSQNKKVFDELLRNIYRFQPNRPMNTKDCYELANMIFKGLVL